MSSSGEAAPGYTRLAMELGISGAVIAFCRAFGRERPYLSAASCWEIAIKYQLGRLPLPEHPEDFYTPALAARRHTRYAGIIAACDTDGSSADDPP